MIAAAFTLGDWVTIGVFGLMIAAKVGADLATYFTNRHNSALARIAGMAGREAGSIARVLQAMPTATNLQDVERNLIKSAVDHVTGEMGTSMLAAGATTEKVTGIVKGELDKLLAQVPAGIAPVVSSVATDVAAAFGSVPKTGPVPNAR